MSPETLQTLGVLAIGLGFVLIGLGGVSTYHASHKIELREAERKGEMNAQIMTLLMKNQELQYRSTQPATAAEPERAPVAAPPAGYYRVPSPPPPIIGEPGRQPEEQRTTESANPPAHTPDVYDETPPPVAHRVPPVLTPGAHLAPEPTPIREEPPPPHVEPPPATSDWQEPSSLTPEINGRYLSGRQRQVIADTLRAHGRHVVTIESSYGDAVSREFAEELGDAFSLADWVVRGIEEHRGLPLASGVTVSAASFPPQQETRAVYEALLSAGIAVTQQLDPKQHSSETVVMVGSPL